MQQVCELISYKLLSIFSPVCLKRQQPSFTNSEGTHYFFVLFGGRLQNPDVRPVQRSAGDDIIYIHASTALLMRRHTSLHINSMT